MADSEHPARLRYSALGVTLTSELALPLPMREPPNAADAVLVDRGLRWSELDWSQAAAVARIGDQNSGYEIRRATPSVYLARLAGGGALGVDSKLGQIALSNDSPALVHVAVNLGLAIYLVARGECVLHAAAFTWEGRAHALVGGSRAGKSTLAAIVCWAGALAISDDTLRVRSSLEKSAVCYGGTVSLRLRPSASELAGLAANGAARVSVDGRTVIDLPWSTRAQEPLASIWFAHSDPNLVEPALVRLSGSETFQRLIDGIRIRGLADRSLMERQLSALAILAQQVPAFEAHVPHGPPFEKWWGELLLSRLSRATHSLRAGGSA